MADFKKHYVFKGKILIVGFGAVGQGTLPLILRHIDMPKDNVSVITAEEWGREIAEEYGVAFRVEPLTQENYVRILDRELKAGDFLFNASFDVSSLALIEYCRARDIMYLDACIEPWAGVPWTRSRRHAAPFSPTVTTTLAPAGPLTVQPPDSVMT